MNMSDKIDFSLPKIYREFHDKTALNFILYKVQNFYSFILGKYVFRCSILFLFFQEAEESLNICCCCEKSGQWPCILIHHIENCQ